MLYKGKMFFVLIFVKGPIYLGLAQCLILVEQCYHGSTWPKVEKLMVLDELATELGEFSLFR